MVNHSNHIPNDLALKILAKLPVKSLKRFSCVQKSWLNLLENSDFKSMYYENLKSKTAYSSSLLLCRTFDDHRESDVHLLSGERYENIVTLDLPSLFEEYAPSYDIVDCVNGIICHKQKSDDLDVKIGLWNPKTDERKIIPPSIITDEPGLLPIVSVHGFGYDIVNDDYKVIQCVFYSDHDNHSEEPKIWQIYSLKSNCWKNLELEMNMIRCVCNGSVTYLNGVCHWWVNEYNEEQVIVSFNLSTETFRTTSMVWLESNYGHLRPFTGALIVLNESLALISSFVQKSYIEIFILDEVGVEESWVKLFRVGPFPEVNLAMRMGNKCDVIFFIRNYNDELASFDVITGKVIHNIGIKVCDFHTWIYKENLLSFTAEIN